VDERITQHIPHSKDEGNWARWRPKAHRTPLPEVNDRVLYRAHDWADPVGATVLEVLHTDPGGTDWNCWRVRTNPHTARPLYEPDGTTMILDPHPDAWPTLLLKVDGQASHVMTREARLRGSAGWLPLDWQHRTRPLPGERMPR
jgi:hypothetical protein